MGAVVAETGPTEMLKSCGAKLVVTGLPRPVTRSWPMAAEYPFDPDVMSRKSEEGDPSA